MGLLRQIKRLLGIGGSQSGGRSAETAVTVERERDDAAPETTTEDAVKGTDEAATDEGQDDGEHDAGAADDTDDEPVAAETDAAASTESLVDEAEASDDAATKAEPAEAAGPESDDVTTDIDEVEPGDDGDEETNDEDDPGADVPVDRIKGIGPAYAERLGEIGIETVADLAAADAEEVAERTSVSEKRVGRWIDRAVEFEA